MTKGKKKVKIAKWRKDPGAIDKFMFVHHFLPHPEKKERAKLLSFKAFGIYIVLVVALMGLFRLLPVMAPGVLGYASNINVKDLLDKTNSMREDTGLNTLVLNEKLSQAAHEKALHMFENDYWAHVSPEGVEPWDFILGVDYDYIYAGENLAKNFSSSSDVVKAWMESPTHRDNILNRNYKEIGFAVVNGTLNGYETTLVVQMFGQPRNLSQIATKVDEDKILRQVSTQGVTTASPNTETIGGEESIVVHSDPMVNVGDVSKYFSVLLVGFVLGLLVLDIWYSAKKGIFKFTGHTVAHLLIFIFVLFSIWFVLKPGAIL